MNFIKRMIIKWVREDWEQASQKQREESTYGTAISKSSMTVGISSREVNSDPTLQFKIYNAIGGKVVEFSRYDRKQDRSFHDIYIIGRDEDFGAKIAKIAMLETLKD
jgi:hypothetical protein